ncbi:heterogeneous nuclear ribonucleoprotein U-like protein 1 isoform X2 [Acropora millepora]|uniref:heterogeneous nuclear ribonucleoprotein U-like protein 1 isoform X2 n=1 Tax=Acropora millepora TaxID=45264 RepID=UPI001CF4A3E4|nr:heterogeneous nuclear ribonucleoprotein U-like protein 1 isoform X2 [Acropora millepora]
MSDLDEAGVKKLKVAELRAELQSRGLDSKGNKPVLVDRLLEAISNSTVTEANGGEVVQEVAEQPQEEAENIEEGSPDEEIQAKSEEPAKEEGDDANQDEETTSETVDSVGVASESVEAPAPEPASEVMEEEPSEKHEEMQSETTPTPTEEKVAENEENDKKTQEGEPMETSQDDTTTSQEATEEGKDDKTDKDKDVDDEDIEIVPDARNESAEEETPLDDSLVVLDKYNCDLHLKVAPDGLSGKPLADEGFSYLLAGARATWGTTKGKVCFECKVTSFISVELPESEEPKNVVRVGWSTDSESLQLGEVKMSYGYDSSGKKALDAEFTEYGQSFGADDVIGCYLDLESDPKTVSFTKNGEDMGVAFEFTEELSNQALFPHVLIKNAEFVVNFGSQEEPWFPPKEGYTFMQSVGEDSLVHGTRGPASKKDCEVIMMVGLPASGKTSWVNKQVLDNPEKKYNVLGTNSIMEKMKVFGVARKRDVGGYSKLMDKAAKCLHRLFELAPTKTRNYILDQTNVYLSAQKKKIRPFEGFIRRAIVCIPTQEELKTRTEDRKKEGIELPENAVSDMKMSFTLPKVGEFFEEVIYADQPENKAKTIVDEYIKEGRSYRSRSSSGPEPPFKRSRFDDRPRHGGGYNRNRSYEDRGGYRRGGGGGGGGGYHRFGGGRSHYGYGGSGGYRGGRGGGGYHDRRDHRGGGGRGGYGGGGYGGGGGGGYRQHQSSHRQQQSPQQPRQRFQQNYGQQQYSQLPQSSSQSYSQPQQHQQQQVQQQQPQQYGSSYNQYYSYNQGYQAPTGFQQTTYAQPQQQQQQQQQQYGQTAQQTQQQGAYQNYQSYYAGYQQQTGYGSYGGSTGYQ